jgi:hypothetical protein
MMLDQVPHTETLSLKRRTNESISFEELVSEWQFSPKCQEHLLAVQALWLLMHIDPRWTPKSGHVGSVQNRPYRSSRSGR